MRQRVNKQEIGKSSMVEICEREIRDQTPTPTHTPTHTYAHTHIHTIKDAREKHKKKEAVGKRGEGERRGRLVGKT